jgi:hypothetical protein
MARRCRLAHCSEVGRYLGQTGGDAGILAEAAPDPLPTCRSVNVKRGFTRLYRTALAMFPIPGIIYKGSN